jgi:hypothetical protein
VSPRVRLGLVGSGEVGLQWVGLVGLGWVGLDWIGWGRVALRYVALHWVGLVSSRELGWFVSRGRWKGIGREMWDMGTWGWTDKRGM